MCFQVNVENAIKAKVFVYVCVSDRGGGFAGSVKSEAREFQNLTGPPQNLCAPEFLYGSQALSHCVTISGIQIIVIQNNHSTYWSMLSLFRVR